MAALADMRFTFIDKAVQETVVKPEESKEHARSRRIDEILTGKYTAIPTFVRDHGSGVLADVRRDRRMAVRDLHGAGHRAG